jgi:hypothetical protein
MNEMNEMDNPCRFYSALTRFPAKKEGREHLRLPILFLEAERIRRA